MRMILLIIVVCTLASCGIFHSDDCSKNINARFWTKNPKDSMNTLLIDGIAQGKLPFSDDTSDARLLEVPLKCGRYILAVRTPANELVCDGTLFVQASRGHTEINTSWTCPDYEVVVSIE